MLYHTPCLFSTFLAQYYPPPLQLREYRYGTIFSPRVSIYIFLAHFSYINACNPRVPLRQYSVLDEDEDFLIL